MNGDDYFDEPEPEDPNPRAAPAQRPKVPPRDYAAERAFRALGNNRVTAEEILAETRKLFGDKPPPARHQR